MNHNLIEEIKSLKRDKSPQELHQLKEDIRETLAYRYNDPYKVVGLLEACGLLWS